MKEFPRRNWSVLVGPWSPPNGLSMTMQTQQHRGHTTPLFTPLLLYLHYADKYFQNTPVFVRPCINTLCTPV